MEKFKWSCDQKLRDSWDNGTNLSFEKDRAYGFSWPQRNYCCSFCKKEFKSAQALGGHMNVHRRDRARMRLSPSWDSPNSNNLNPNSNPNLSTSSTTITSSSPSKFLPYYNMSCHPSLAAADTLLHEEKASPVIEHKRNFLTFHKNNEANMVEFTRRKEGRVWKAKEFVRLDLNMGTGSGMVRDTKEELDLELRLGYS